MKHVIIGTAGHIDHGKTTLIRALTGRNTDRLQEEQKRGISIDLGFTYFDLPSGLRAGIIDVPGHEKFIKNMLAGVVGIDIVLLVVAADEGVMPQTAEHLNILQLLGLQRGMVVLTKADMVEKDWLALVKEDVRTALKGTFLEKSAILPMSSVSKEGMDDVISEIERLASNLEEIKSNKMPRIPIDRVFTIRGFGTVVTGTLLSGELKVDDEVEVFPVRKKTKIRSIQVHDQPEQVAFGGQRVAINLPNIKKEDIHRGDVVAPVGSMVPTMMLDAVFTLLKDTIPSIGNRRRVRIYIGSKEVLARMILLEQEELKAGEQALVQFRLEEEIVATQGDRFIVRFYSPMFTIGGGEVIDANPKKRKRFDSDSITSLWDRLNSDEITRIESIIRDELRYGISLKELAIRLSMETEEVLYSLQILSEENKIVSFNVKSELVAIHREALEDITEQIYKCIVDFHENNPYREGIAKEEVLHRFFKDKRSGIGDQILNTMISDRSIVVNNGVIRSSDFLPEIEREDSRKRKLYQILDSKKFDLIKQNDLLEELSSNKKIEMKQWKDYLIAMIRSGDLLKVGDDLIITKSLLEEAKNRLIQFLLENKKITLAEYRDILENSRRPAMSILDYFDEMKVTVREGDYRFLANKEKEDGVENIDA